VSELRAHVATSDCEAVRRGLIGQPANTVSSLGFVAAGVAIDRMARHRGRPAWRAVAAAAAVEGLGSVAYHGPGGAWSKGLHDAGLVALGASVLTATGAAHPVRPPSPRTVALTVAAVALHSLSRTGGPLCACRSPLQGHAVFHVLAAAALVSAAHDA
jgi:hypothetical protein